jgi:DNA ligase-associated metallophosphoesterase
LETTIAGHLLRLLPEKAMLMVQESILVIADAHIGKIEHFRAAGIGVPGLAGNHTLDNLFRLIEQCQPSEVIFLGDLFHSVRNSSVDNFEELRKYFHEIPFHLVSGNHDILPAAKYQQLGLHLVPELIIGNIWLTHEPSHYGSHDLYNIAGHIHPAVRLKGAGKQSLTLPCFYFGPRNGILPAFGYFTGKAKLPIEKDSAIFAIADQKVFSIPI